MPLDELPRSSIQHNSTSTIRKSELLKTKLQRQANDNGGNGNSNRTSFSERDRQILRSVKRRATYLDKGCTCCCFTFGFDFIIGLIPVIGDAIGMILGLELIKVASKADLPKHIQFQMLINVMVDFVLGLAPVVGDLLDAVIKCNWRNAMILEDYLMLRRRDEIRAEKGLAPHDRHHHLHRRLDDDDDGHGKNGSPSPLSPESQPTANLVGKQSSSYHHMYSPEGSSSASPPRPAQQQEKKYGSLLPRF
ncbi:unnamed protein product [Absidia cylindrospora]